MFSDKQISAGRVLAGHVRREASLLAHERAALVEATREAAGDQLLDFGEVRPPDLGVTPPNSPGGASFGDDNAGPFDEGAMDEFDGDLEGRSVMVIDDAEELERLCNRPAPGADDSVGWNEDMADMAGESLTIAECHEGTCGYGFEDAEYTAERKACPSILILLCA